MSEKEIKRKEKRKKERRKRGKMGTRQKRFSAQGLEAQRQTRRGMQRAKWSVMSSKSVEEDEEELNESFEDDDVNEEEPAT
jgi:hypothetical protein